MIFCNNISKSFGKMAVIGSFSAKFNDNGFYLLHGESGSGKTTFLNILSGLVPFDSGSIVFDNAEFSGTVDADYISEIAEYITQDSYFVPFLSVMDNMKLICRNDNIILEKLKQFGLEEKVSQKPNTLSGGEKQRLALARAMLRNRKILFLDEPTAALDDENKRAVFGLLRSLKEEILIICTSHDETAKLYADEVIAFSKDCTQASVEKAAAGSGACRKENQNDAVIFKVSDKMKNKELNGFLIKWFKSDLRSKSGPFLFVFFIIAASLLLFIADFPENKLETAIEKMYKLNFMTVDTIGNFNAEQLFGDGKGISEILLEYDRSFPNGAVNIADGDGELPAVPYENSFKVLPFSEKSFKLADKVKYGTYFTSKYQVILSAEMAEALSPSAPEKLLGTHISKSVYSLGNTEFEIVGIFDYFNDFEKMYLSAMGISIATGADYNGENYKSLFFVNSELTRQFENDKSFYSGPDKQRCYILFFESYGDMREYYEEFTNNRTESGIFASYDLLDGNLYSVFELMFAVMLPIAVFASLFACVFFVSLKKTEYLYNSSFIAVFEYSGYNKKTVIRRFISLNMAEVTLLCITGILIAAGIAAICNLLNERFAFAVFEIFSFNPLLITLFTVFQLFAALTAEAVLFKRVRVLSWYESLIRSRDLI